MNVTLPPEFEAFVIEQVENGVYPSPDRVVQEALRLLKEQDERRQAKLEDLRQEIAIGLEQIERGEVAPLDIEAIIAEGKRQLAEQKP
jgi:antitoxin ParD1/3/4